MANAIYPKEHFVTDALTNALKVQRVKHFLKPAIINNQLFL